MELRSAFLIFVQYIKSKLPTILHQQIEQLITQLKSNASDIDIKTSIQKITISSSTTPTHQRTPSQPVPVKPPQPVKANALIGATAFQAKPFKNNVGNILVIDQTNQVQSAKKSFSNLEISINKQANIKCDSGKFTQKIELQNALWLCIRQFQQHTETLFQIYNCTSEIQTAYGIRVSQDIRASAQVDRKGSNPLFTGYNSKLMSDDQLLALQNNFLVKKQIVKAKKQDFVIESPLLQQKQIFLK